MIQAITSHIHLLLGDPNAICPSIGIISGKTASLFVDLSNRQPMLIEAEDYLKDNNLPPLRYVLFTHFHDDHIANLQYLEEGPAILSSKNTSRYLSRPSTLIKETTKIDLGEEEIIIIPVPSLHAKGCLTLLVDDYLFLGDSLAPRESKDGLYFDSSIAFEMEKTFSSIPFSFGIPAHPGEFLSKEKIVDFIRVLRTAGWAGVGRFGY